MRIRGIIILLPSQSLFECDAVCADATGMVGGSGVLPETPSPTAKTVCDKIKA